MTYVPPNLGLVSAPVEMSSMVSAAALTALTHHRYATLDIILEAPLKTLFCYMRPAGRPSFTPQLLNDLNDMQRHIYQATADADPFRYFVFGSRVPGSFNLGGDLDLFREKIRAADREALRAYGHACIDAVFQNITGYDQRVITVGLVQGAALGGGFEAALSCHHIVAERSATFGLPEVLFNLFPGMGAYSFLSRRLDAARAEKLILSGRMFSADEMHEMGIVDHVAEDGEGEAAVRAYIGRLDRRYNTHRAVMETRHRINPITREELIDVVEIWVEAALRLQDSDLRTMARLVRAQSRRHEGEVESRLAAD
ncbi:crotonase/enoyl-CoA hydratase family protein [Acidisoma sp. C75]